jgi:hypothetical protein
VVKAQLEGLNFWVPICVVTEVCHLCTSIDYININTLLIFLIQLYVKNICITFHECICYAC